MKPVVALFIMAIILVTQFNSFYSAFLIRPRSSCRPPAS